MLQLIAILFVAAPEGRPETGLGAGLNSMNYNQQTLVAPPDEEVGVIDSFVEASREINPTVQVTLAKRIVRPGSNKVLCLAARTSVPLNEDEIASVSDLALRLSDGTNVKLSLSFFNDEYGMVPVSEPQPVHRAIAGPSAPYISMSRSFFDPTRYTPYSSRNESKLGMAIFTVILGITAGIYFVTERPLAILKQAKVTSAKSRSAPVAMQKASILPAIKSPNRAGVRAGSKSASKETASVSKPSDTVQIVEDAPKQRSVAVRAFATRKRTPAKQTQKYSLPPAPSFEAYTPQPERPARTARAPKSMFVPPPPPTMYTIDPAMFPPYMQWQPPTVQAKADKADKAEKTDKATRRPPNLQSALNELQPQAAGARSPVVNPSSPSVVSRLSNSASAPPAITAPTNSAKIESPLIKAANSNNTSAAPPNNNNRAEGAEGMRAPVAPMPGADQVSFERIRIPGQ